MQAELDLAIVGGGASGLAAACAAAEQGCRVAVLERGERVGRKLLVTGNGKCNLTNRAAGQTQGCYFSRDPNAVRQVLAACPPERTLRFFRSIGLLTRTDAEGRVYPYSEQASAVLDVLRAAAQARGAEEQCGFEVAAVQRREGGFVLRSADATTVTARAVIVACGGPAAPQNGGTDSGCTLLRALGHPCTPLFPALVPLQTEERRTRPLKGVRVKAAVTLLRGQDALRREEGELQFGDGLLSGICVFQLSQLAGEQGASASPLTLSVDLMPGVPAEETAALLEERARQLAQLPAEAYFTGLFQKKIGYELLRPCVPEVAHRTVGTLTAPERAALARLCRDWRFPVTGTGGYRAAQVTAGGARLSAFDPATLGSRQVPGLFACGEVLDADGVCGGFNLQWAWSTGLLAGAAAAAYARKDG